MTENQPWNIQFPINLFLLPMFGFLGFFLIIRERWGNAYLN